MFDKCLTFVGQMDANGRKWTRVDASGRKWSRANTVVLEFLLFFFFFSFFQELLNDINVAMPPTDAGTDPAVAGTDHVEDPVADPPVADPVADPVAELSNLIVSLQSGSNAPPAHPEADEARKQYDDHQTAIQNKQNEIEKLTKDLTSTTSYGVDNEFLTLKDKCIKQMFQGYNYEICLFKKAYQGTTSLGNWDEHTWSRNEFGSSKTLRAKFTNGQRCYNGPSRSMEVELVCGVEDKILDVSEPSVCEYKAMFSTPAACTKAMLVELEQGDGASMEL